MKRFSQVGPLPGLFLLPLLFGASSPAFACSCAETPNLEDAFDGATSVFSGRVTGLRKSALREGQNEVQFSIMKAYKGAIVDENLDQAMVYTPDSDDKCQYDFQREQDYLVFATGNLAYLKVDRCSRTGQLDAVMQDIETLDKKMGK